MAKTQLEQWVNLNKDPKWVEDEIKSVERVGELHFEVKFNKAKLANFKIKVKPAGSNIAYSAAEAGRNKNFRIEHGAGSETNLGKKKVLLQRDVSLPMAGGNEYIVRVLFKKKQIESTKAVVVRRKLLYWVVTMDSSTLPAAEAMADPTPLLTSLETDYWQPAKNYYIKLTKKGSAQMPLVKNLLMGEADETGAAIGNAWGATYPALVAAAKTALAAERPTLQARKPFCFVSIWCNYIASKGKKVIDQQGTNAAGNVVTTALPSWFGKLFGGEMSTQTLTVKIGAYLWHGLNDADDAAQHWLESVEVFWVDANNATTRLAIPRDRVVISDAKQFALGGHKEVKIDLTNDDMAGVRRRVFGQVQGTFLVRLKVRTASSWTNGFAMPGKNGIVVADKAQWEQRDQAGKRQTLNHEFGHKIGMTAQGGKDPNTFGGVSAANTPDAPVSLYGNIHTGVNDNSRGHQGNHCCDGVAWTQGAYNPVTQRYAGTWSGGQANCVMFGSNGFWDGGVLKGRSPGYCGNCEPIVRKLDLGTSMPGFSSCVTD